MNVWADTEHEVAGQSIDFNIVRMVLDHAPLRQQEISATVNDLERKIKVLRKEYHQLSNLLAAARSLDQIQTDTIENSTDATT